VVDRRDHEVLRDDFSIFVGSEVDSWEQPEEVVPDLLVVREVLSGFDRVTGAAVVLDAVHGYRHNEVGERLGITAKAVEGRIYRFRERLHAAAAAA
jgi:DNA-directed RNA polymerase specialized sigma24 family protein